MSGNMILANVTACMKQKFDKQKFDEIYKCLQIKMCFFRMITSWDKSDYDKKTFQDKILFSQVANQWS